MKAYGRVPLSFGDKESALQDLRNKRLGLEKRHDIKVANLTDFQNIRIASKDKLLQSTQRNNEEALERNKKVAEFVHQSLMEFKTAFGSNTDSVVKLEREKERYLGHVGDMLPQWKRLEATRLEEKVQQLRAEQRRAEDRRVQLALLRDKEGRLLDQHEEARRDLVRSSLLEDADRIRLLQRMDYMAQEGRRADTAIAGEFAAHLTSNQAFNHNQAQTYPPALPQESSFSGRIDYGNNANSNNNNNNNDNNNNNNINTNNTNANANDNNSSIIHNTSTSAKGGAVGALNLTTDGPRASANNDSFRSNVTGLGSLDLSTSGPSPSASVSAAANTAPRPAYRPSLNQSLNQNFNQSLNDGKGGASILPNKAKIDITNPPSAVLNTTTTTNNNNKNNTTADMTNGKDSDNDSEFSFKVTEGPLSVAAERAKQAEAERSERSALRGGASYDLSDDDDDLDMDLLTEDWPKPYCKSVLQSLLRLIDAANIVQESLSALYQVAEKNLSDKVFVQRMIDNFRPPLEQSRTQNSNECDLSRCKDLGPDSAAALVLLIVEEWGVEFIPHDFLIRGGSLTVEKLSKDQGGSSSVVGAMWSSLMTHFRKVFDSGSSSGVTVSMSDISVRSDNDIGDNLVDHAASIRLEKVAHLLTNKLVSNHTKSKPSEAERFLRKVVNLVKLCLQVVEPQQSTPKSPSGSSKISASSFIVANALADFAVDTDNFSSGADKDLEKSLMEKSLLDGGGFSNTAADLTLTDIGGGGGGGFEISRIAKSTTPHANNSSRGSDGMFDSVSNQPNDSPQFTMSFDSDSGGNNLNTINSGIFDISNLRKSTNHNSNNNNYNNKSVIGALDESIGFRSSVTGHRLADTPAPRTAPSSTMKMDYSAIFLKGSKGSKLYDDEENEVEDETFDWVPSKMAEVTKDPNESDEFE